MQLFTNAKINAKTNWAANKRRCFCYRNSTILSLQISETLQFSPFSLTFLVTQLNFFQTHLYVLPAQISKTGRDKANANDQNANTRYCLPTNDLFTSSV